MTCAVSFLSPSYFVLHYFFDLIVLYILIYFLVDDMYHVSYMCTINRTFISWNIIITIYFKIRQNHNPYISRTTSVLQFPRRTAVSASGGSKNSSGFSTPFSFGKPAKTLFPTLEDIVINT